MPLLTGRSRWLEVPRWEPERPEDLAEEGAVNILGRAQDPNDPEPIPDDANGHELRVPLRVCHLPDDKRVPIDLDVLREKVGPECPDLGWTQAVI